MLSPAGITAPRPLLLRLLLLPPKTPTSSLLCKTLATTTQIPNPTKNAAARDEYLAAVQHIANIVRRGDPFMERTLSRLRLSLSSDLVLRVLRACSASAAPSSLRFFYWALSHRHSPSSLELDQLLRALARARHWRSLWSLTRRLRDTSPSLSPDPSSLSFLIEEYGRAGLPDHAVLLFNRCPSSFSCPQTTPVYNSLLFALCEARNFHAAYALVRRMIRKGAAPDRRTFSVLIDAWCAAGKLREAQEFLAEMSKKGFNPPVRGRDLLLEGLLNAGYVEAAKDMVRRMTKEGALPDIATFNALLEAVCKLGEVDFAVDMYLNACRLGLCVNINTYKVMIPALSKAGIMDEAFRLLHRSIEDGHRPFPSLYAPLIKALCKRGQFGDAFCFFSDMKVKGHPPNRPVYTMLITMCGRGGRFIDAANYLMEMSEMNLMPLSRCFDMVTDGLKHCGKHELAKRIEQLEISLRGV